MWKWLWRKIGKWVGSTSADNADSDELYFSTTIRFKETGYSKPMSDHSRIVIYRHTFTDKSTIGDLFIDNKFECYTLEDTCRTKKIPKITAIPPGRYKVVMYKSPKFNRWLPLLEDVPGYSHIEIHNGNTPIDTEGCILVGRRRGEDSVSESLSALDALIPKIQDLIKQGDTYIQVIGGSHHTEAKHVQVA